METIRRCHRLREGYFFVLCGDQTMVEEITVFFLSHTQKLEAFSQEIAQKRLHASRDPSRNFALRNELFSPISARVTRKEEEVARKVCVMINEELMSFSAMPSLTACIKFRPI